MHKPSDKTARGRFRALSDWLRGAAATPPPHSEPAAAGARAGLPQRIGHYSITGKLGQGGMGVVYAARDERLERTVAVKTMASLGGDETARKRFWREAKAAASVNHPNVCQLYEIGEDGGELFIAMELLEGETLTERLNINVDSSEALDAFAQVPPERRAAVGKSFEPVASLAFQRGIRTVSVGNDLYPTTSRAQLYGVSKDQLADSFWSGVNVDYQKLQATAQAGVSALAGGKEVHVTNPNGTDLRMRIEGRPVLASDGVISDEDDKKGGAACAVYLPAGEVYLAPVPGTAEGKVVVDRHFFEGKEILGLTLTFSGGKLVSMTAKSGLEPMKVQYDAAGAGKDLFGALDIGINPNLRYAPGSRMLSWVPAGMVTIGVGNNQWAGGDNGVAFGLSSFLPGSTLKVDGKALVENGVLRF